jgi:transposase
MWFAESQVRVGLYRRPTDMRRSFDGLAAMVKQALGEEPTDGALNVFVNRCNPDEGAVLRTWRLLCVKQTP